MAPSDVRDWSVARCRSHTIRSARLFMSCTTTSGWWSTAEGPLTPVDERRMHACGFRSDAVEGVVGDEQDLLHSHAHELSGPVVGRHVRLERIGNGKREYGA